MTPLRKFRLQRFRRRASKRQGGGCFYCGCPMWNASPLAFAKRWRITEARIDWFRETAEHLVPVQDGGTDTESNIVAACHFCNSRRHRAGQNPTARRYLRVVQNQCKRGIYPTLQLMARGASTTPERVNGRLHPRVA